MANEMGLAKGASLKTGAAAIAEIVGITFMSRTYTHMAHLKTASFAKHKALNDFYDDIVDLADSLAESAQGLYGKLDVPFVNMQGSVDKPIEALESQLASIKRLCKVCDEPFIENIVQEIEALYRSTIYKLRELA